MIDQVLKEINWSNGRVRGKERQLDQTQEELAELIQAINKWKRWDKYGEYTHKEVLQSLIEEIADVKVTVMQIEHLLNLRDEDIDAVMIEKILEVQKQVEKEKVVRE